MNKKLIKIDETENGVTIWYGGRWLLDASTFIKDGSFSICKDRLKEVQSNYISHRKFVFDDDYEISVLRQQILEYREKLEILELRWEEAQCTKRM
jgi:hypothetical protein